MSEQTFAQNGKAGYAYIYYHNFNTLHGFNAECNDPRAAGTSDRVVTDLILVMEKSEECRSEWVQEIPRVPQSREHKCLQL